MTNPHIPHAFTNGYRPFYLGLTGGMGMGKTTTAAKFHTTKKCPVWSADDAVHFLYSAHPIAIDAVREKFPFAYHNGQIDRGLLSQHMHNNPKSLPSLEKIIHPFVHRLRCDFQAAHARHTILVFEIPLLFETNMQKYMDAVLVVTAPPAIQEQRLLKRPHMTQALVRSLLARQMPNADKIARADYVIETTTHAKVDKAVQQLLSTLKLPKTGLIQKCDTLF